MISVILVAIMSGTSVPGRVSHGKVVSEKGSNYERFKINKHLTCKYTSHRIGKSRHSPGVKSEVGALR